MELGTDKKKKKRQRSGLGGKPQEQRKKRRSDGDEEHYWDQLGAEFEVSDDDNGVVGDGFWSDSDDDDGVGQDEISLQDVGDAPEDEDEGRDANKDEATGRAEDTADAIIRRWKEAQRKQQRTSSRTPEKGKRRTQEEEEEKDTGGDSMEKEEEEEEEKGEEVKRVRKGPGSVSFAVVLGQLLGDAGKQEREQQEADGEDGGDADAAAGGDGTTSDPILVNFKKRKPSKKLEAERRRKREAGELALKKKLLKARDHRIPTVISEPAEVRLRKLATKGVIQLFNAVRKQQKLMNPELAQLEKKNPLKAERLSKNKFLQLLQTTGAPKKGASTSSGVKKEPKEDDENEEDIIKQETSDAKPKWDVLSDDYMLGASLKDLPDDDDNGQQ